MQAQRDSKPDSGRVYALTARLPLQREWATAASILVRSTCKRRTQWHFQRDNICTLRHLTFEISGEAGFLYDELLPDVDSITVSNPAKMTWIYRMAKKNDRLDARKQAVRCDEHE